MLRNTKLHIIWVALLCASWLQSSHFSPWVSFHSELVAFAAVAALFVAILLERSDRNALVLSGPEISLLLALVLIAFQAVTKLTQFTGDAAIFALYLVGMIVAMLAGRRLGTNSFELQALAYGVVFAGICSAIVAALQSLHPEGQYTFVNPMPSWGRSGANLAQPNHLGTLILWAVASTVYLYISQKISKYLAFLFCTILLIGLAMTESRTALIGVFAIAAWLVEAQHLGNAKNRWMVSIGFAVFGAALFLLWPSFLVGFQEGGWFESSLNTRLVNAQAGTRLVVWPQLLAAITERPLLGWGFHGVSVALNAVLDRYSSSEAFTYAHNVILELAIGFGVPLTVVWVGLATYWCVQRMKHVRNAADWYAASLLIPFALHSMLEFPFAYTYFLFPACLAIGVLDARRSNAIEFRLSHGLATTVFFGWTLIGLIVVRDYVLAEEDFRVARFEALKIGQTPANYLRPHILILDQLDAMNAATRTVPAPGMTADSLALLKMAAQRFPWPAIQNRYALSLALNGNVTEAQRQLAVMRAMHGPKIYAAIVTVWDSWANEKYPQLEGVALPPIGVVD